MNEHIKILVCTHKEVELPRNDFFFPIQVGSSLTDKHFDYTQDNIGENISDKNRNYCELTAHYWAWKNLKCNIIGLNHYRRYFDFQHTYFSYLPDRRFTNTSLFTKQPYQFPDLEKILEEYDIILPPQRRFPYKIATQYAIAHIVNDLNVLREVIKDLSPDYLESFDHFMYHHNAYSGYNMFITHWKYFDGYSQWLFLILFELEKRVKLSAYTDQARLFGYLSERLINIYCLKNKLKIKYVPIIVPLEEDYGDSNPSCCRYFLRNLKNDLVYKLFKL